MGETAHAATGGAPASETATATILVTDVVGSTALRQRLGEERADDARRRHDSLLATAVERSGGTVVKNLGDGVLGRFTSAADAVAAAVRIQQETDVVARKDPVLGAEVRVGLSAGDVTLEDGDCFGTPVIEASRLCDAADGGQVLAATLVQLLARGRGDHRFVPIGDLELKGLEAPVGVVEVEWTPVSGASVPLPASLRENARFPFTGREGPLATILERWQDAQEGARHVLLVSGEPGVGKTRLVAEAARRMHEDGGIVLLGRADESVKAPMRPVGSMLDHLVAHVGDEVVDAHVARHDGLLAALAPALRTRRPDTQKVTAEDPRAARIDAATDLLRRTALGTPVILVFDDLHWADDATLHFLRHLAGDGSLGRLLVIGMYRDTDLVRGHPLAEILADLRREDAVERLDLDGLDADGVRSLMTAAAGHELEAAGVALAGTIHRETDGNPFFVGEVLVHLAESGAIEERDGRWVPTQAVEEIGVPQGIREVVGRRVSSLGDGADEVLRAASAIGSSFDLAVLARVVEVDETTVLGVLERGVERGLLGEDSDVLDRFEFIHALIRTTLYEELSASRRVRLHAAIGDALAEVGRDVDVATIAHHACEAAVVGDPQAALELAVKAAGEATEAMAPEAVTEWWDRAFEMEELIAPASIVRRAELLLARGNDERALIKLQNTAADTLQAAADAAREGGREDLVAEVAVSLGPMVVWGEIDSQKVLPLLEEGLGSGGDDGRRIRLLRSMIAARFGDVDLDRRLTMADEAIDLARTLDHPALLVGALLSWCTLAQTSADRHGLEQVMGECRSAAVGAELDMFDEMLVKQMEVTVPLRLGHFDEARDRVEELFVLTEDRGWWGMAAFGHSAAAGLELLAGRPTAARAHVAQGWSKLAHARPILEVFLRSSELTVHHVVGDSARERAGWDDYPDWLAVPFLFPREAKLAEQDGELEVAVDGLAAWGQLLPFIPWTVRDVVDGYVSSAWRALPADLAATMRSKWQSFRGVWLGSANAPVGSAELTLGRLALAEGDTEAAIADLDTALQIHTEAGEVSYRAHVLTTLSEALLRRGTPDDRARAKDLADEALDVAVDVGLLRVSRDARDLLDRLP